MTSQMTSLWSALREMKRETLITATEFKAKCLRLLEELGPRGLVITKRGIPVARVLPMETASRRELIGSMRGQIRVHADLLSTGVLWNAQS